MAFGFPAYHAERLRGVKVRTGDLHAAVKESLAALAWKIREQSQNRIVAATSTNLRSWGEVIEITFPAGDSLLVISRCRLPTQCFDWGKNKANVRRFEQEIRRRLE